MDRSSGFGQVKINYNDYKTYLLFTINAAFK